MPIKSIFHVNVNCRDLERSQRFYELLGFHKAADVPEASDPGMLEGLGLPADARVKGVLMSIDPTVRGACNLDLLEWTNPPTTGEPYGSLTNVGAVRIALFVTELDAEFERLHAAGVSFLSDAPVEMADMTRFACFYDPDGTVIEMVQLPRRP